MKKALITYPLIAALLGTTLQARTANNSDYEGKMDIPFTWEYTKGREDVVVAVINTGVNISLFSPENLAKNPGESGNGFEHDGIDNDQNGYIDDVYGVNTLKNTGDPSDVYMLGTYVSSLLVSPQYGLAPNIKVLPIAVTNASGASTTVAIAQGISYALERGASIIEMSLGGGKNNEELCALIKSTSIPFIVTAGNSNENLSETNPENLTFPVNCAAPNMFVVASSDPDDKLAPFSSYGKTIVDAAAPGLDVEGLGLEGKPVLRSGGSIAAAYATGVAALVLSYHPEYTTAQLFEALRKGVDKSEDLEEKTISGGRLNAAKALFARVSP